MISLHIEFFIDIKFILKKNESDMSANPFYNGVQLQELYFK